MIFHTPDASFRRLRGLHRRARRHAIAGSYAGHPLEASWSNARLFMGASYRAHPVAYGDCLYPAGELEIADRVHDLVILDWFASCVDKYASKNMIDKDVGFGAICNEVMAAFKDHCNPERLIA